MRVKKVFENLLIELNKRKAPSLLLDDFIYFANKAVGQCVNLWYAQFQLTQQMSDNLRVLQSSAFLSVTNTNLSTEWSNSSLLGKTYEVNLPDDYLHMAGCVVEYTLTKDYKCYASGSKEQFPAARATSAMWSGSIINYYFKPSYKTPYYYITNVTTGLNRPTTDTGTAITEEEKVADVRYGNPSKVRMEIRYGKSNSTFELSKVYLEYLRFPKYIDLTEEQLEDIEDTSQILEFPDDVCQEIINRMVFLIMENASDPRLPTNIPINQTMTGPSAK